MALSSDKASVGSGRLIVGIDTGGTFTDVVYRSGAASGSYKLLSTPQDPGRAVIDALLHLFAERRPDRVTYSTTIATNAMLERRGARTALVTTAGFEDVIEIGRQDRRQLYDLEPVKPEPLVPRRFRSGVAERVLFDGSVAQAPTASAIKKLGVALRRQAIESIAVCFLHAHVNGAHERKVARELGRLGIPVSLSHRLSPEAGEYERTNTTVANAYVRPLMDQHLSALARRSGAVVFRVMQSNGGAIGVRTARREPIRTMLSGPAGGVAAAFACTTRAGIRRAITFDMGGTSTDVALIDGTVPRRSITIVGDIPVRTPCIDIHTVGAGGGSIASVDAGGSLKVGPQSAGADPGPACYGRGNRPTVTDANVVLGRLRPDAFLGGTMPLDMARARRALARLARDLHTTSIEQAAEGVLRVIEGAMERAIRVITVERGQDPRGCTLVAFGGAAPLHACGLAAELGIKEIVVPADPGLLSAWGVIDGPVVRDYTVAHARERPTFDHLSRVAARLQRCAVADVAAEGVAATRIATQAFVRLRYLGQALQLEVPLKRGFRRDFDHEHERLLHTSAPQRPIEATGVRVTAVGRDRGAWRRAAVAKLERASRPRAEPARVYLDGRSRILPVYARELLAAGSTVAGPAVVTEYSSTVLVGNGWHLTVDEHGDLRINRHD